MTTAVLPPFVRWCGPTVGCYGADSASAFRRKDRCRQGASVRAAGVAVPGAEPFSGGSADRPRPHQPQSGRFGAAGRRRFVGCGSGAQYPAARRTVRPGTHRVFRRAVRRPGLPDHDGNAEAQGGRRRRRDFSALGCASVSRTAFRPTGCPCPWGFRKPGSWPRTGRSGCPRHWTRTPRGTCWWTAAPAPTPRPGRRSRPGPWWSTCSRNATASARWSRTLPNTPAASWPGIC